MRMINDVVRQFRNGLTELVRELDGKGLTPATFVGFVGDLKALVDEVALKAFVQTVLTHEERADVVEHGGQQHRFKMDSDKEWITPFGDNQVTPAPASEPQSPSPRATAPHQRWFAEMKRRKVFRVIAVYGASSFVILQAADVIFPAIPLPDWSISLVLYLLLFGFPIAVVLAWAFDVTPDGVGADQAAVRRRESGGHPGHRLSQPQPLPFSVYGHLAYL